MSSLYDHDAPGIARAISDSRLPADTAAVEARRKRDGIARNLLATMTAERHGLDPAVLLAEGGGPDAPLTTRARAVARPAAREFAELAAILGLDESPARQRQKATEDGRCGTDSGYQRHRRLHQYPCEPCRIAHNDATRERDGHR